MELSNREKSLFRIAKEVSHMSDRKQHKLGAVIYYKHKVIGTGCNSNKTDAMQAILDINNYGCNCEGKLHAESSILIPIIKRKIDISGAELYIYREKKDGSLGLARPCSSCMKLIKQCKIKKIYYTTDDGYAVEFI